MSVDDLGFLVPMANRLRLGHKLEPRKERRLEALYELLMAAALALSAATKSARF